MNQIARVISTLSLFLVLCALPAIAQNAVGTSSREQTAKVNVSVDRQLIRFTAQEDGAQRRLVVTNQQGEALFDSGFTSGNILEWSLKGPQGDAIASGLYNYTLTTKTRPDALPITEQGQVIVDRVGSQDRMLLTSGTQSGVGADGRVLKVTIIDDRESRVRATDGDAQARQASDRAVGVGSNVRQDNRKTGTATTEGSDASDFVLTTNNTFLRGTAVDTTVFNLIGINSSNKVVIDQPGYGITTGGALSVNGNVGVGTTTPTDALDVTGDLVTGRQLAIHNRYANGAEIYSHSDTGFRGPVLSFYKSRNTQVAPAAVQGSDNLGYFNFGGHNGTSYVTAASIWSQSRSNWSGSDNSADLQFYVTPASSTSASRALYIAPSGNISIGGGAPTGGNTLSVIGTFSIGNTTFNNTAGPANGAIISGSVGIGTTSPSTFKLQVAGSVGPDSDDASGLGDGTHRWTAVYATNGTIQTSDARLKKGMTNLNYGLREVMQLRPISFQWKDSSNTKPQIGLVAQEVEKVIPEVVQRDANASAPLGMNYGNLVPVVIKAVQEQQATITTLKTENAELKQQNAALEARLSALEKKLEQTAPAPRQ